MILKKCNHLSLWKKCLCAVKGEKGEKLCNMDGHYTFRECGER